MVGALRLTASTAPMSKDGPGAIACRARMATGIDGQTAVRAGGPARRQHPLGLAGEGHHLLRGRPEPGRRQLVRVVVLVVGLLARHDDEQPLALVEAQAQLTDDPLGLAGLGRRYLDGLRRRAQALGLQQLPDADDQALNVEFLAVDDEGLGGVAGAQEELATSRGADGANADAVDRIEVYASSHCPESTFLSRAGRPGRPTPGRFGRITGGKASGTY